MKIIFLDYLFTIPNATNLDEAIVQTSATFSFAPLLLLFVFLTVFLGGINRQKARTGTSDYAMWATTAALSTFMIALIMTLTSGLISLEWLVVVVVLTIFCGVWLFLDRKSSEI